MHALRTRWTAISSSLWFVPLAFVFGAIALGLGLTTLDTLVDERWISKDSRVFGTGAEGSRGMLSAIAGSMMTVASLTFSLTISTLATASSQYTSRLIRNFMRDRVNQIVLGYFVGLFSYCLVVLRAIRSGDDGSFVPSIAVLTGLLLALLSVGVLIYFIHHIAESIQASVILDRVSNETIRSIDTLFPAGVGEPASERSEVTSPADDPRTIWHEIESGRIGSVQSVDTETLIAMAAEQDSVVRMEADIGAFVTPRSALCSIASVGPPDEATMLRLRDTYAIGPARTISQDPAFGIRQIVDIGLKALSPGVNDTTTGVMAVQHLGSILEHLGSREIPDRLRAKDGRLRLIARGRSFEGLVRLALDQMRNSAEKNVAVLVALFDAITVAARQAKSPQRAAVLRTQLEETARVASETLTAPFDREAIRPALMSACLTLAPLEPLLAHTLLTHDRPRNQSFEK